MVAIDGNEIPERNHLIGRGPFRSDIAQGVTSAVGDNAEVRIDVSRERPQAPTCSGARKISDTRLFDLSSRLLRATEQQVVQVESRIDQDRTGEFEFGGAARDEARRVRLRIFFGVSLLNRKGYWLYAL